MKQVICLNKNWYFSKGKTQNWEIVCLPHSVELTPENSSGGRNYQGEYAYRKAVYIPEKYKGKKLFLKFDGAMGLAVLSVNGKEVDRHFCGYTPFVADITDFVEYEKENELYLALDNSDDASYPPGKPQELLDFSYEGGIYRNVTLTVCEPLYITDPLLTDEEAGGGIFVWYTEVSEQAANVNVKLHTKNEYTQEMPYQVQVKLVDALGKVVGEELVSGRLPSGACEYQQCMMRIDQPKLWSPEYPNLYQLQIKLRTSKAEIGQEELKIGIRDFHFTVENGVLYNGISRRFNSANYHQTWPYIGNAVPDSLLERDVIKLRKAGFDNIRSHYPFSTSFVEACDRHGMTLIVSNPGWQFYENGIFAERVRQNMRDIIRWQRNHPCILIWEPLINETPLPLEEQQRLHELVHAEYPFQPCYTASDTGPTDISYRGYDPDMFGEGMLYYPGIQYEEAAKKPCWVREYGDSPDDFYNQSSIWRSPRGWGDFPMIESVNRMLGRFYGFTKSNQYIDVVNNKRICGYGIWPGISHNRGYHINPCWGGHLDLFRIPKFSYYFMQSQQDRQAGNFLYIANWWSEMSPADVTVFSNAEIVRLYVDGQLVGEQAPDDVAVKHPPFTFKNVKRIYRMRERSELRAEALVNGVLVAEKTVFAPGIATHMKLEADEEGIGLKADGSDIIAVRCCLLDDRENIVPLTCDQHPILFEVNGEGRLVGDSTIGANPVCAEAGIATILVQSSQFPGKIRISARMLWKQKGAIAIKPAELVLESEA